MRNIREKDRERGERARRREREVGRGRGGEIDREGERERGGGDRGEGERGRDSERPEHLTGRLGSSNTLAPVSASSPDIMIPTLDLVPAPGLTPVSTVT